VTDLKRQVTAAVLVQLAASGVRFVPVAVSARHVHLSEEHIARLFGPGHRLGQRDSLSQPDQFAARETVTFRGSRGEIGGIRVLGPARAKTQVELSVTDCVKLGLPPEARMSGDPDATPGGMLIGPAGELFLAEGVIVARRHLHMSDAEALVYGLRDGDAVCARVDGLRPGTLGAVVVRAGPSHLMELHIDTDEANAFLLKTGDLVSLEDSVAAGRMPAPSKAEEPAKAPIYDLITERVVNDAVGRGETSLRRAPGGIVTPAGRDRAMELKLEIAGE
jgi:putative phosphotransacetylase